MDDFTKKVIAKINKKSFNKENPTELLSQLVKVLTRDYGAKADNIVKEIKKLHK